MSHEYFNPVRSVYGAGALSSLPGAAGRPPRAAGDLSGSARARPGGRIEALLGDQLAGVIDDVRPNPDVAELKALYEGFWRDARAAPRSSSRSAAAAPSTPRRR